MSLSRAPRLAEGQVTLRAALLLLGLWAVLAPSQCSLGRPSWRYSSSEVVIPRKELHRGKGVQVPGWLSYSLHFGGQRHVIHMWRKKLFLPGHLPLMTQDDQGALQMDYPFIPSDCYYLGYLEEIPLSMVTLDTCHGGLEGIMKLDDLTYEIKPLTYSERFEHVVSQLVADASETGPVYRSGDKKDRQPLPPEVDVSVTPRISSRVLAYYPGYITAASEFSNSMYRVYNNVTLCMNFILQAASMVDSFYRGLFITFHLIAVLLFNVRDPTRINDYRVPEGAYAVYHANFQQYTGAKTSIMYVLGGPRITEFEPRLYSLCSGAGSLIFVGHLKRHIISIAIHTTRAIGRQCGLYYDEDTCICLRRSSCIMGPFPAFTDSFSNCSMIHMQRVSGQPHVGSCVLQQPSLYFNKTLIRERCGNSEVDSSEDCDCGSFKQCYNDPCCKSNCMFEEGAECHKADCCTNCTWSKKGTLCRPIKSICDLPEYCIGAASVCGDDLYMQDGTPCSEEGFCYNGSCTDPNVHCRELFGRGAFQGHDACYTINKGQTRFGHCNYLLHRLHFHPCLDRDIKCGRLQCSNVTQLPPMPEQGSFHQSRISGAWCWGTSVHITHAKTIDTGHVRNGTLCAPGKICYRRRCNTNLTSIRYDCPPKKCNFRGVCNNYGECFCHIGWRPPTCILRGPGGSMLSGPPSSGQIASVKKSQAPIHYLRVAFGRLYAFLAAILFGVATNVKSIQTSTVEEVTVNVY